MQEQIMESEKGSAYLGNNAFQAYYPTRIRHIFMTLLIFSISPAD
ncbi:hypothetical protein [Shewanella algae]